MIMSKNSGQFNRINWYWQSFYALALIVVITLFALSYSDKLYVTTKAPLLLSSARKLLKSLGLHQIKRYRNHVYKDLPIKARTFESKLVLIWYRPFGSVTQPLEYVHENHEFPLSRVQLLHEGRDDQVYVWWYQESGSVVRESGSSYFSYYYNQTMDIKRCSNIRSSVASVPWLLKLLWNKQKGNDWMKRICLLKKGEVASTVELRLALGYLPTGPASSLTSRYISIPSSVDAEVKHLLKKKNRLVTWVVSNCGMSFGARLRSGYHKKLKKAGLKVDVFGSCGRPFPIKSRWDPAFFEILSRYKFYLAMPNSYHCDGYITEKTWYNALYSGAVPIIFGPHRSDVAAVLPPKSYIHAENYKDAKTLVKYLLYLDKNVTAYAEYLEWRSWIKFLDKTGNFQQIINKDVRKYAKQLTRKQTEVINKFAGSTPTGFCGLCRKLYEKTPSVVADVKNHLLSNRPECFDEELASKMSGLPVNWG